jgi:hypothetical protein
MSSTEYPFSRILITLHSQKSLVASSIMFPSKGRPEIYFKEINGEKWLPIDIYSIERIEFEQ